MRNIEIKARFSDFARARAVLAARGARPEWTERQTDTFFAGPGPGLRLKLRQAPGRRAELITYARPDEAGPRASDYRVEPVTEAQADALLARRPALGVVRKLRELWRLDHVRIHLDDVDGLGRFLELEAVVSAEAGAEISRARVEELLAVLAIPAADLVPEAYVDLLQAPALRPAQAPAPLSSR